MDTNDLLGVSATFDRVALAVERDGLDAHALERVMAWGPVTFGRQLTRRDGGTAEPFVKVCVTGWRSHAITDRDAETSQLLARVLRELSYLSKAERLGFDHGRLDAALDVAREASQHGADTLRATEQTLQACIRYTRSEDERGYARIALVAVQRALQRGG